MRRWKQDCLSKNDAGFTLVELLASLAILSLIIGLIGSVTMFGIKQYDNQTFEAEQANDYSYALTVLSKEIRSAKSVTVANGSITVDGVIYAQTGTQLIKTAEDSSQEVLADYLPTDGFKVSEFKVSEIETNNIIAITIKNNGSKTYQTTIYLRGDNNAHAETKKDI